jgi:hypothetical protein
MITEEQYQKIKKQVDDLKQERDRAAGALKQIEEQLWKEFKCRTLKKAKLKLKRMIEKEEILNDKFTRAFKAFKKEFGPLLKAMERDDPDVYREVPTGIKSSVKRKKGTKKAKARG